MRLSPKRQSAVYAAISGPIFTLRLRSAEGEVLDRRMLDRELYQLKREIVAGIWSALEIDGAPPEE